MKPWPNVRLGEVLRRSEETIELQPDTEYRQITVKLWGKGVVLRGILTGAEIAASRQMVARRGQFILSRIDARNGARTRRRGRLRYTQVRIVAELDALLPSILDKAFRGEL